MHVIGKKSKLNSSSEILSISATTVNPAALRNFREQIYTAKANQINVDSNSPAHVCLFCSNTVYD
jgi:long-subunit fatty acid transport protein